MKFYVILLLGIGTMIGGGILLALSWSIADLIQSGQLERMARESGTFQEIDYDGAFSQMVQLRLWGVGLLGVGIGLSIISVVTRKQ